MVARGTHPNSLANLRPPWIAGSAANPLGKQAKGPVITPAIRHYAEWETEKLLNLDVNKLPIKEALAIAALLGGLDAIDGRLNRADLLDRLDGALKGTGDLNLLNQGGNVVIVRGAPELGA